MQLRRRSSLPSRGLTPFIYICLCLWLPRAPAHAATIVTFDAGGTDTLAVGINTSGSIAGSYFDSTQPLSCIQHGFVRAVDGTITTFDPGNGPPRLVNTATTGINDLGQVVGFYREYDGNCAFVAQHGFVRDPAGAFTSLDPPSGSDLQLVAINNDASFTGYYLNASYHGVVGTTHAQLTTFDPPRAVNTFPSAINDRGIITGYYMDNEGTHGFLRNTRGKLSKFDVPSAQKTFASGISSKGLITGSYRDTNAVLHGYVRMCDGTIATFDPTGSTSTLPFGIGPDGLIVGEYTDANHRIHGFLRRSTGAIKSFDVSGAFSTAGIAANNFATISGTYFHDHNHGFVRIK
jgi:hypothetical protein